MTDGVVGAVPAESSNLVYVQLFAFFLMLDLFSEQNNFFSKQQLAQISRALHLQSIFVVVSFPMLLLLVVVRFHVVKEKPP